MKTKVFRCVPIPLEIFRLLSCYQESGWSRSDKVCPKQPCSLLFVFCFFVLPEPICFFVFVLIQVSLLYLKYFFSTRTLFTINITVVINLSIANQNQTYPAHARVRSACACAVYDCFRKPQITPILSRRLKLEATLLDSFCICSC